MKKINFTKEQQEIIDLLISEAEKEDGKNIVISGSGGTGKTTIIVEVIEKLLEKGISVAVCAMTGKATAVLRGKIHSQLKERNVVFSERNLAIKTVSKLVKESKVIGISPDGKTAYASKWVNPDLFPYDILIVDELSMVPSHISWWWQLGGIQTFGFGDQCQLPEVLDKRIEKEIKNFCHDLGIKETKERIAGYGVKILSHKADKQLHKVLRSENEIAGLCNDLRDFSKSKDEVIYTLKKWAKNSDNIEYSTDIKDLKVSSDWQILAYTNRMCEAINKKLCIGEEYPTLSDKIVLLDNLNRLGIYNGDTMLFGEFLEEIMMFNRPDSANRIYVCMKWRGQMPRGDSKNPIERKFFETYSQFKTEIDLVSAKRIHEVEEVIKGLNLVSDRQKTEWLAEVKQLKSVTSNKDTFFEEVVEQINKTDRAASQKIISSVSSLPQLYIVDCNFAYALTVHRAQGSEFPKVCYLLESLDKSLLYTGVSRAKTHLSVINLLK